MIKRAKEIKSNLYIFEPSLLIPTKMVRITYGLINIEKEEGEYNKISVYLSDKDGNKIDELAIISSGGLKNLDELLSIYGYVILDN